MTTLSLLEKKPEQGDASSLIFKTDHPISWKPGQFFHYILPHTPVDDRGTERWFTISSSPYDGNIMITTRFVAGRQSSFKKSLHDLALGDTIAADGPEGDFTLDDLSQDYIFIAGGIGVTPFRAILRQLDHDGAKVKVKLLYANRDDNFVFKDELTELAQRNSNLQISYFVDPSKIDEAAIRNTAPDLQVPIYYISGPEPMVDSYKSLLTSMGVAADKIKTDHFPGYLENLS